MFDFSRKNRLVAKHDFQSVFANATKVTQRQLIALSRPNELNEARLGVIIPKQHARLAVTRNTMRRLIRESFRHHKAALKGLDIIVLLRSKWTPLDKRVFREQIDNLWQRINPS